VLSITREVEGSVLDRIRVGGLLLSSVPTALQYPEHGHLLAVEGANVAPTEANPFAFDAAVFARLERSATAAHKAEGVKPKDRRAGYDLVRLAPSKPALFLGRFGRFQVETAAMGLNRTAR
jgi:hypothetical protein